MNIGTFTKQDGAIVGNLPTLGFQGVSLERIAKKGNGPDYFVSVEGAELGAAWDKTAGKTGRAYISVKVVIPGRPAFYIALFQTETEGQHNAVYSEPEKQTKEEPAPA